MNLNRVFAIIIRHYFTTLHQLERFFDVLVSPILVILLWGFLTSYVKGFESSTLASFLLGGIILWIIFEKIGTDIGVNFMFELWDRNFINLLSTPLTFLEFLTGLTLVSLIKIFISFLSMWFISAVFYNFHISSLGFGFSLFVLNLFIFAASFGIFNISLVIRFGHSIGPLTWLLPFLIQPFSAVFYPVSILPDIFQKIAYIIPISHVFEGMRYVIKTGHFSAEEFWTALVLNIIFFFLSVGFFGFILKSGLKSGRLVKLI